MVTSPPAAATGRFFCAERARLRGDSMAGTASPGLVWVLIEYPGAGRPTVSRALILRLRPRPWSAPPRGLRMHGSSLCGVLAPPGGSVLVSAMVRAAGPYSAIKAPAPINSYGGEHGTATRTLQGSFQLWHLPGGIPAFRRSSWSALMGSMTPAAQCGGAGLWGGVRSVSDGRNWCGSAPTLAVTGSRPTPSSSPPTVCTTEARRRDLRRHC